MKGGCTSEVGSFWDGGVFWYYNDIIMSKSTLEYSICQKHDRSLAQGSKRAAYRSGCAQEQLGPHLVTEPSCSVPTPLYALYSSLKSTHQVPAV